MNEQLKQKEAGHASLRDALQALLDEGLDGPELIYGVRVLLPFSEDDAEAQPTTDDATVHPGYQ